MALTRDDVIVSIDIERELVELLGPKTPGSRKWKCYNKGAHSHGDANPSLTASDKGYYKCQTCGVKGDIFSLYMETQSIQADRFAEVLLYYARKYGVDVNKVAQRTKDPPKDIKGAIYVPIVSPEETAKIVESQKFILASDATVWLMNCYGISEKSILRWGLGWNRTYSRLMIPIPYRKLYNKDGRVAALVNVRRHDILRSNCDWVKGQEKSTERPPSVKRTEEGEWDTDGWKPQWGKRGGKVIGIKGHNTAYLYPMEIVENDGDIWLVGGELKALLLIQLGLNAVTFTSGEGNYSKELLKVFTNRTVRVIMDIDEAGTKASKNVGNAVASAGGKVLLGTLPPEGLPYNGDITDFLRINKWDTSCLSQIQWEEVESKPNDVEVNLFSVKDVAERIKISFAGLTEAANINKNVEVSALISGRGTTPFAVPGKVAIECSLGRANHRKKCNECALAKMGYSTPGFPQKHELDLEQVVDMTGVSKTAMLQELKSRLGIPPRCEEPDLSRIEYHAVEKMIVVPTIDIKDSADESLYRHHQIYVITDGKDVPEENESHLMKGRIVGEPKNNAFTFASVESTPVDGDVFDYRHDMHKHMALREAIWTNATDASTAAKNMVVDVAENVVRKHGINTMVLVEMLSWFAPFGFMVGPYECHKVCPEFLIVGDTRVGKSTTSRDLAVHFGAGRYLDCGANATFVGLVGGNSDMGNTRVFTWGAIPMSNRGHLTLDETNKLPLAIWGGLTNLKSSGVAERTTNNGVRKTKSQVRLLTLCNPRSPKPLSAYQTPLDAAIEVVGTPQDLARIDFLYVAYGVKDYKALNTIHESTITHRYTKENARYHLQWAWSLSKDKIKFRDPEYVLRKSNDLHDELGGISLIAPAEAKFKIGRMAIAIATMLYEINLPTLGLIVDNDHVDIAYLLIVNTYRGYLANAGVRTGVMPKSILAILNRVKNPKFLRILTTSDTWSQQDFDEIFREDSGDFKYQAQLEHGLMSRKKNYFVPIESFRDILSDYVNTRLNSKGE